MRIAVISDTHDSEFNTRAILKYIAGEGADTIIHCGDMCSPHTAELFRDFCIYHAWGNNDFDTIGLQLAVRECKPGSQSDRWIKCLFDGKLIAALHEQSSALFSGMVESGQYDFIFVGHTHRKSDRMYGKTRVINPGAIGGARRGPRGFVILDTVTGEITDFVIDD